ncbi:MAG: LytTR family DNA-binding domain-containing protein [Hespellia sp.]|nr:LytTR family DNA-binding domain-containing protein [Hespellia sp.]
MVVAICDDEKSWVGQSEKIIKDYAKKTFLDLEAFSFSGREELFTYEGNPIEVIFLDIDLADGDNGISLAEEINQRWPECQIVFVTNYIYYATEIYHTEHIFFVLKEQFSEKVGEVFRKVLHVSEQRVKKLVFTQVGGDALCLSPRDIRYFERDRRVTNIHSAWGEYHIWDRLNVVEELLPDLDFVRCHNSYILYLPEVLEMQKNWFIMKDEKRIPISRRYVKHSREAFMQWALLQMS